MKGPSVLTIMMLMSLAILAYADAAPHVGIRNGASLFGRSSSPYAGTRYACRLGSHYSSFYGACTRTSTPLDVAATN